MIQVLAPHPDDAALSLGHTLARLCAAGQGVRIITCFSRSAWAPHVSERKLNRVTALRRAEDQAYAALPRPACELLDLGGTDAPFRGHYPGRFRFFHGRPFDEQESTVLQWLTARLLDVLGDGPLLLPLALGDHIDHRLARAAGLTAAGECAAGFYEDLPYAIGRPESDAMEAAASMERPLRPVLMREWEPREQVRAGMALYRSQLDDKAVEAALDHAHQRGGERLWLDREFVSRLERRIENRRRE